MPDFDYCHCVCKSIFFLKHTVSFFSPAIKLYGHFWTQGLVLKLQNSSHGVVVISKLSLHTHSNAIVDLYPLLIMYECAKRLHG